MVILEGGWMRVGIYYDIITKGLSEKERQRSILN
jgi:hypothetical protein